MNDNKFNIRRLVKWREESAELFRSIGMRPQQYMDQLGELADAGTDKVIASASQFLMDFKECGPDAMTERHEISRATAYNHRTFALRIVSNSATGN